MAPESLLAFLNALWKSQVTRPSDIRKTASRERVKDSIPGILGTYSIGILTTSSTDLARLLLSFAVTTQVLLATPSTRFAAAMLDDVFPEADTNTTSLPDAHRG
jgi:hypothetical protein